MKSLSMIIVKKLTVNNIKLSKVVKKIYPKCQKLIVHKLANFKEHSFLMKTALLPLANKNLMMLILDVNLIIFYS